MSEHTDFYVGLFTKIHQSNKQYGLPDEYCWSHDPGGWTCLHCHLIAFFEAVGAIADRRVDEENAISDILNVNDPTPYRAVLQEGTSDYPTARTDRP